VPIAYKIDKERRRVIATAYETLTDADVFNYQREVWSRADVAGYDEIVDMRAVKVVELPQPGGERLRELAATAASMDAVTASRFAIVAPDDLAFGLGRMYAAYRDVDARSTKNVRVFRTMEEAVAWLDEKGRMR
jgi:hypothetical protein